MIADLKTMLSEIKEEDLSLVYCLIREELISFKEIRKQYR